MNSGFWDKLAKPIFALAPMADVTDAAFRRVIAKYGKPDVTWTEFVSADGLALAPEAGRKKLLLDLMYSESERPIVAQFFTSSPENMRQTAELARELGFDGVDINMGCPQANILAQGAGAALIKDPKLAREVIRAAKVGAGDLPVSVKTRLGFNKDELETWLPELLAEDLAAVTIHARTKKEMSKVAAHWNRVKRAVEIRDELGSKALVLGNGDVEDLEEARMKVEETGADGVMLGRAIFGNPWLFKDLPHDSLVKKSSDVSSGKHGQTFLPESRAVEERLKVMVEHTKLFEELLGQEKNFAIMKKHYKAYVKDFAGAAELRGELMAQNDAMGVEKVVNNFFLSNNGSK